MHQSNETLVPRPPGRSGGLTAPRGRGGGGGFKKMSVNGHEGLREGLRL